MSNANVLRAAVKVIERNVRMGWPAFVGLSRDLLRDAIKNSRQPGGWLMKIIAATGGRFIP